ncbi:MAG: DUF2007 domain-containing protein [Acidobacteriia bacterium]|nr:DUF2007 domain-containing protein [Terriglobia bacterium]
MRTWSDGEAEIVRHLLEAYGIPCQVVSDVTHMLLPLTVDGLGEIRILVPASSLEEAVGLLAEHRRRGFDPVSGGEDSEGESEGAGSAEDDDASQEPR